MTEKRMQTLEILLLILIPVKDEFYCRIRKYILKHLKEWGMSHLLAALGLTIPFLRSVHQPEEQYSEPLT